jgi:hypothetical protein
MRDFWKTLDILEKKADFGSKDLPRIVGVVVGVPTFLVVLNIFSSVPKVD